jgi:thiamine pyridinylase
MYPYIPDKDVVLSLLSTEFKKRHPSVELVFIDNDDLNKNYYKGGLLRIDADIYEVDTILLTDMLGKISELELAPSAVAPETLAAVTRDGRVFAMPHWMCGNFLFFKSGDSQIDKAASWEALLAILAERKSDLLVDFKGSSGLGEWYLTVLADRLGIDAAQKEVLEAPTLSDPAVQALGQIIQACPAGFCRNDKLHEEGSGAYAKIFVRGQHAAYIGYSESIYWGLQDGQKNCRPSDKCLTQDGIAVRRLPPFGADATSGGIGWVDGQGEDGLHGEPDVHGLPVPTAVGALEDPAQASIGDWTRLRKGTVVGGMEPHLRIPRVLVDVEKGSLGSNGAVR